MNFGLGRRLGEHTFGHLIVAASAWLARFVSSGVQLALIPVLLKYLGSTNYSIFLLLMGLGGWFALLDFGVGNSIQNIVAEQKAKSQDYYLSVVQLASIGFCLLIFNTALMFLISRWFGPLFLSRYPHIITADKVRDVFLTGLLGAFSAIGGIAYKIWYGEGKGYNANIALGCASLVVFVLVTFILPTVRGTDTLLFAILFYQAPPTLLSLTVLYFRVLRAIRYHKERIFDIKFISAIYRRSWGFLSFSLLSSLVLQVDYIIMSHYVTPKEIIIYSISTKTYNLAAFLYSAVLYAVWPVLTSMISVQNHAAVKATLKRYLLIGLGFIFCAALIITLLLPEIGRAVLVGPIIIPTAFLAVLGIYQLTRTWTDTYAMGLQSINRMQPLIVAVPFQAVLSIGLLLFLTPRFGINGTVVGLIVSYLLTVSWFLPFDYQRHLRKLTADFSRSNA